MYNCYSNNNYDNNDNNKNKCSSIVVVDNHFFKCFNNSDSFRNIHNTRTISNNVKNNNFVTINDDIGHFHSCYANIAAGQRRRQYRRC